MNTHVWSQHLSGVRLTIVRYSCWTVLGLLLGMVVITAARVPATPAHRVSVVASTAAPILGGPHQRVLNALQWYVAPAAPFDAAQRPVLDYLHAHGFQQPNDATVTRWDVALRAVRDYLGTHR